MKGTNLMENSQTLSSENKLYTLQLASKLESITELEKFIDNLKDELSIPEEIYANILTCMTEAVINSILHGNKENPGKKVYINVESEHGKKLIFSIKDEGDGFDYTSIPDPTLAENIELFSGRGIYIIQHLADQVVFNKSGNEIELTFRY